MSAKSIKKKVIKQQKQAEESEVTLRNFHAEDATKFMAKHRETCQDPSCDTTQGLVMAYAGYAGSKIAAGFREGFPNTIFIARYGTGDKSIDYKPFLALQLKDTAQLAEVFENGKLSCAFTGETSETWLTQFCHRDGVSIVVFEGHIKIICKTCQHLQIAAQFTLAPRPKAEYPNVYCSVHGIEPSYYACQHVLDGGYPDALFPPTHDASGEAFCDHCYKAIGTKDDAKVQGRSICQSAMDNLLDGKLKQMLAERETELVS